MIKMKRKGKIKGIDAASCYEFSAKQGKVLTIFLKKYEIIGGFVCCQNFPRQPRKILGTYPINFKTYPTCCCYIVFVWRQKSKRNSIWLLSELALVIRNIFITWSKNDRKWNEPSKWMMYKDGFIYHVTAHNSDKSDSKWNELRK